MAPKAQSKLTTNRHPFLLSTEEVARQFTTSIETGLTAGKVQELQGQYPPNELEGGGAIAWYKILLKQISNAMILVSWVANLCQKFFLTIVGARFCNGSQFWSW